MGDTATPTLHALLGLSHDVTVADLRFAYDRAMAMAVRVGDTQRALALSRAFDALPTGLNRQVYPAVAHRRAPVQPLPTGRRSGLRPTGLRPTGRGAGRARRRRLSRARRLTLIAVAFVVIAVPLGIVVGLHWKQWMTTPSSAYQQPVDVPTVATTLPQ